MACIVDTILYLSLQIYLLLNNLSPISILIKLPLSCLTCLLTISLVTIYLKVACLICLCLTSLVILVGLRLVISAMFLINQCLQKRLVFRMSLTLNFNLFCTFQVHSFIKQTFIFFLDQILLDELFDCEFFWINNLVL